MSCTPTFENTAHKTNHAPLEIKPLNKKLYKNTGAAGAGGGAGAAGGGAGSCGPRPLINYSGLDLS